MPQKYRAQILLEPEQHDTLQRISEREGQSVSEVARKVIRIGLEALEKDVQVVWDQRMFALERLSQIRESVQKDYGVYQGNLVAEARAERERQQGEVMGWETKE
jgi:hypothetical protein